MKTIGKIIAVLTVLAMILSFAACGKSSDDKKEEEPSSSSANSENSSAEETAPAVASAIVGTWESIEAPGTSYTFNADGTGELKSDDLTIKLTYADEDAKLTINYIVSSDPQVWTYTIEGDTLTMTEQDTGTVLAYTKK